MVNKKRVMNLDLGSLTFPPMAIISILHRISGVVLFLLLPFMLFLLDASLQAEKWTTFLSLVVNPYCKLVLWAFSVALMMHLLAGIRHLLMDMGIGESLKAGRYSALLVLALTGILTIFLGIWIW